MPVSTGPWSRACLRRSRASRQAASTPSSGLGARRDDTRIARRLYRKQLVDGVYRLDEGALLDDFFHFLQAIEVMALLEQVDGTAIPREMLPVIQSLLLYGLKTLFGIESMNALP